MSIITLANSQLNQLCVHFSNCHGRRSGLADVTLLLWIWTYTLLSLQRDANMFVTFSRFSGRPTLSIHLQDIKGYGEYYCWEPTKKLRQGEYKYKLVGVCCRLNLASP